MDYCISNKSEGPAAHRQKLNKCYLSCLDIKEHDKMSIRDELGRECFGTVSEFQPRTGKAADSCCWSPSEAELSISASPQHLWGPHTHTSSIIHLVSSPAFCLFCRLSEAFTLIHVPTLSSVALQQFSFGVPHWSGFHFLSLCFFPTLAHSHSVFTTAHLTFPPSLY